MSFINLVHEILTPLNVPVLWQLRPQKPPGITYHFYNEQGELYGDGGEIAGSVACQIDIWSTVDYTNLKKQVKAAMKQCGFLFVDASDFFEEDAKVYHCVLIFNYYYESEGE